MKPIDQPPATDGPDLTSVVQIVLGDLAFMLTDEPPAELPAGTVWTQGEIHYVGQVSGTLRCWCTREFAARLAANLLGLEPDMGEAQVAGEDAVRELMNVLCGQLVTLWHGTQGVFKLTIPTVRECIGVPAVADAEARHVCRLSVEGEPLLCVYQRHE